MSQEKSRIDSFNVSLGGSSPRPQQVVPLDKWNILVCSDLGFASKSVQSVRIADWNEFMAACNVTLQGTVPQNNAKPFFFDYAPSSMKDFSADTVALKAPALAPYSKTVFALQQLLAAKTSASDVAALVRQSGLDQAECESVLGLIGSQQRVEKSQPASKQASSPLDNILSMVNSGQSQSGQSGPALPHTATEALFKSVVSDNGPKIDAAAIQAKINALSDKLSQMVQTVMAQQFFSSVKASWSGLMTLAKVVGRTKDMSVQVFSVPGADREDRLPSILSTCMEQGIAPDIIVWDFPLTFASADMQSLGRISQIVEQYKSLLVAPLSMQEALFEGIADKNDITHFFDSVAMLPYKSFRKNQASRCVCLCGPSLAPLDKTLAGSNACWYVAVRWAEMVLSEMNPFAAKDILPPHDSVFALSKVFGVEISNDVVSDAARNGITLFEASVHNASLDKAVSAIDCNQVAAGYLSFLFNLLVNRVVRLAGIRLLRYAQNDDKAACAGHLQEYIATELCAYGAVSRPSQVVAAADDEGKISIEIDSDTTVSGNAIRFAFSF